MGSEGLSVLWQIYQYVHTRARAYVRVYAHAVRTYVFTSRHYMLLAELAQGDRD